MLTIFSIPKPFTGHSEIIQRNAIQSWLKLDPECEIILFANEYGTDRVAAEFGILQIPDIECNEYGTPLINDAFEIAQLIGNNQIICYVNADIIMLSDLLKAVQFVHERKGKFLLIGKRRDVNLDHTWDFAGPEWEKALRDYIAEFGALQSPGYIDYFVFPRGQYNNIPRFAVGRPGWDTWLVYWTRYLRIPVIDATESVTAIHQNHGYGHVPYGENNSWWGPEGNRNLELAGGYGKIFTIQDANICLTPQGLKRQKLTVKRFIRYFDTLPVLYPRLRFIVKCVRLLLYPARPLYRKLKGN